MSYELGLLTIKEELKSMKIPGMLEEAAKATVPERIKGRSVPEGAVVMGELPEELKPIRADFLETESGLKARYEALHDMPEGDDRAQQVLEYKRQCNLAKAGAAIFAAEVCDHFSQFDSADLGVTDDWQVWYAPKRACPCGHAIAIITIGD